MCVIVVMCTKLRSSIEIRKNPQEKVHKIIFKRWFVKDK